ncbi:hypothetical protein F5X98DRAFT_388078 [Xylaria grammica]|nr:hypothetical protein F5X98DRAFT_388078 [Xylaria grammica]
MTLLSKLKAIQLSTNAKIAIAFYSTALVFALNLGVTIWALTREKHFANLGDVYTSSCRQMKTVNILVHLFINVCSSLVLSSCNFCVQCLVAPTRIEVSKAHKVGDWLEIGASSYRNLRGGRINVRRKALAISLFVGSLPLHLLWNSVFFSTIPISSYQVPLVTRDFQSDSKPWDATWISDAVYWITQGANRTSARDSGLLQQMARESKLERLNKTACMKRYLNTDVRHKNVLVVAANISMSDGLSWVPDNINSSLLYRFPSIPTGPSWVWEPNWLCSVSWATAWHDSGHWCDEEYLLPRQEDWTMEALEVDNDDQIHRRMFAKVDYCLSAGAEKNADGCAIRYSTVLLLVVTGLNGCVLACMYFTWNIHRARMKEIAGGQWEEEQLTTLDEAVSNFLQHEDQYTTTATFLEFADCNSSKDFRSSAAMTESPLAAHRLQSKLRWYHGTGKLFCFIGVAIAVAILMSKAFTALTKYGVPTDTGALWRMGIGEAHGYTIALTEAIKSLGANAFYGTLLLANVPQIVLGLAWWLANSLLSRLLLAQRWAQFILKRSGLRVSSPQGQQRRSFFLSLPYRYSIPLIIASTVLHWLLSQSFFVVQTRGFVYDLAQDQFVRDGTLDGSVIGYSTAAFILSLVIALVIFISIALLSMKPLPSREIQHDESGAEVERGFVVTRMPLVSSCSAAISAACHPGFESQETHLKLVQWGKMASGKWSITNETPLRYSLDT